MTPAARTRTFWLVTGTHPQPPADGLAHVLIVDDHPVFRRGLVALLSGEPWVAAVLEASTVADAVREAVIGGADVIAMDLRLPDGDGLAATAQILRARPSARVLILTMTDDQHTVAAALRAGAAGYVTKRSDPEDVVRALQAVARGAVVLGPDVGPDVLRVLREQPTLLPPRLANLSERELAILRLIGEGLSNAQIARQLDVAEKTVRNQLTRIFVEIQAADRVQAALLAREAGLAGRHPA